MFVIFLFRGGGFFLIASCLWLCIYISKCTSDDELPAEINPVPMNVNLTSEEVKNSIQEAINVVRQQIEIIEPHIFRNGKLHFVSA